MIPSEESIRSDIAVLQCLVHLTIGKPRQNLTKRAAPLQAGARLEPLLILSVLIRSSYLTVFSPEGRLYQVGKSQEGRSVEESFGR